MSPIGFDNCVKNGGEVFTKSLSGNKYVHGCRNKGSKKAIWGEVKEKKGTSSFLEKK